MGPELMAQLPRAGRALRRRVPHREGRPRSTSRERPFRVWVARHGAPRPTPIIVSTGAQSLMLGLEAESAADRPRPVDVRHLRRLLLPRPGDRRRRRRRLGRRGGDVPHQVRRQGHAHPPPRRAAGVEDHAGPGVRQPEDRVPVEHASSTTSSATTRLEGIVVHQHRDRRDVDAARHRPVRRHRPPAQHRPVQGPARHGRQRLPGHRSRARRTPTSTACSPAATCRTTPTARRSPPPAPGAWPPSTPSAGSKRTTAPH